MPEMPPCQGQALREHWRSLVVPRGRRHGDFRFFQGWTIKTTAEESRAPIGYESQRQWAHRAMERTVPCLFGLDSVGALLAYGLHPDGKIPIHTIAWYRKSPVPFVDMLAAVRRYCSGEFGSSMSAHAPDVLEIPRAALEHVADALCGAY
jgi:hypothetical protein